jgi:hypothetical protein
LASFFGRADEAKKKRFGFFALVRLFQLLSLWLGLRSIAGGDEASASASSPSSSPLATRASASASPSRCEERSNYLRLTKTAKKKRKRTNAKKTENQ